VRTYDRSVGEHYARGDLLARTHEALRAAGKRADTLATRDLAPIDQIHARGRETTLELARLAGIEAGMRVLDVGGGLWAGRRAPSRASSAAQPRCWTSPKSSAARELRSQFVRA
jgi:hypothetical protein